MCIFSHNLSLVNLPCYNLPLPATATVRIVLPHKTHTAAKIKLHVHLFNFSNKEFYGSRLFIQPSEQFPGII